MVVLIAVKTTTKSPSAGQKAGEPTKSAVINKADLIITEVANKEDKVIEVASVVATCVANNVEDIVEEIVAVADASAMT
jgi:hypothetical protein